MPQQQIELEWWLAAAICTVGSILLLGFIACADQILAPLVDWLYR